jgi:hypothetical protein
MERIPGMRRSEAVAEVLKREEIDTVFAFRQTK